MNKEEAEKAKWEIYKLEKEIKKLQEPLTKYIKKLDLEYFKEKYEGKYFHTNKGDVAFCHKYEEIDCLTCTVIFYGCGSRVDDFVHVKSHLNHIKTYRNVKLSKTDLRGECKEFGESVVKWILKEIEEIKKGLNYGMD